MMTSQERIKHRLKKYLVPRLYAFAMRNLRYIEGFDPAPPPIIRPIWNHPWLNASNTAPLMMALLRLAADRAPLPKDLKTPLAVPLTEEEDIFQREYES